MLENISNSFKLIVEIGKSISVLALGIFVLGIFVAPEWTNRTLERMNLRIESIDTPFIKLVRSEGNAATRNNAIASNAITQALIKISEFVPPATAAEISVNLDRAQKALDAQSTAVSNMAKGVGLSVVPVSSGWLYLGYLSESGLLARAGDRIDQTSIHPDKAMPSSVRLKYDAWVIPDGNDCSKLNISEYTPPAEETDVKYTIIRAANEPLKIIETATCEALGQGKYLWARVEVPPDRARIGSIRAMEK